MATACASTGQRGVSSGSVGRPSRRGRLPGGLVEHLRGAIRVNRQRRGWYARAGGRRASVLSRLLVAAEVGLLPAGWLLDRRVRTFVERGVPILVAELVGLEGLPPPSRPLVWEAALPAVGPVESGSLRAAWTCAAGHDFAEVAAVIARLLHDERARSLRHGRRAAVTAHLLESAGRMAERGIGYALQTEGATAGITEHLVKGHLALVPLARALDRAAAPLHRRGIGLFVNDLPAIPFPTRANAE